jgi:hypothetical protein
VAFALQVVFDDDVAGGEVAGCAVLHLDAKAALQEELDLTSTGGMPVGIYVQAIPSEEKIGGGQAQLLGRDIFHVTDAVGASVHADNLHDRLLMKEEIRPSVEGLISMS